MRLKLKIQSLPNTRQVADSTTSAKVPVLHLSILGRAYVKKTKTVRAVSNARVAYQHSQALVLIAVIQSSS